MKKIILASLVALVALSMSIANADYVAGVNGHEHVVTPTVHHYHHYYHHHYHHYYPHNHVVHHDHVDGTVVH